MWMIIYTKKLMRMMIKTRLVRSLGKVIFGSLLEIKGHFSKGS
jgi:hypothetical protein